MLDRRSNVEQPHPNTCEWILELAEYKAWKADSRGLIWIKGKPGAGKSTLMAFLYSRLKEKRCTEPGIYLEFFYNARGTEMQRTPLGMLRSLLNQLFRQDSVTCTSVREVYKEKRTAFGLDKRNWEWQRPELESILLHAVVTSAQHQPVTIFVDALDEAGEQSAREMATYFHHINDRTVIAAAQTKICISCRHYPVPATVPGIEVCVEKHNSNDIATFVKDHLHLNTLLTNDSPDRQAWHDLEVDLLQRATGVFQWAHLVVPMVNKYIADGDSPEDIRNWLQRVPEELGEVYKHVLQNVIELKHRNQSFLLFQWVCLAERPLSVTEMRYALAAKDIVTSPHKVQCHETSEFIKTNDRMKRRVKTLSGGLVEVVPHHGIYSETTDRGTVQVIHQSVKEFLLTHGLALVASLKRKEAAEWQTLTTIFPEEEIIHRCQATLYRSCLNYLVTENVPLGLCRNERRKILSDNSPWIKYTTVCLFLHAEKAASCRFGDTREQIQLLQQAIAKWVRAYRDLDDYSYSDKRPSEGTTLLLAASAANLTDVVEYLVQSHINPNEKDGKGNTALHLAARWGHRAVAEILLRAGADLQARNKSGRTPLVQAAGHGHMPVVDWLLCQGVNVDEATGDSGSALQAAAQSGQSMIVKLLIKEGADVNAQGGYYGNALQVALERGLEDIMQILLDNGADVNAQGGYYGNALQAAVFQGLENVVQILLDNGADVNAQGGYYGNALQAAVFQGLENVVQILLDKGADVNAQGGYYGNALQTAVEQGLENVVQILLDKGADVNAQGGYYGNALQAAVFQGLENVVQILLDNGADVNAQGGYYGNALQTAVEQGLENVVQILLDKGADVNAQGGYYGNALQVAAASGCGNVVRVLLDKGADVNAQGGKYGNALQAAAASGHGNVVQVLLNKGADVNAQGERESQNFSLTLAQIPLWKHYVSRGRRVCSTWFNNLKNDYQGRRCRRLSLGKERRRNL
ncbi:hypothetical protein GJ744_004145 [Endocarpon pusillum]|uniref:NACHT domain-containing protein n=1 Tax=Endocarpon pusillum TaxID=364733 RepID=A0A8H7E6X0_9EURO|nr:hypothetical protein GJ744_004145 [Endocarpon pusillum]